EHPDWFIQLRHPPYPSYRFTGPDLSRDPRVLIQIEDGYWSRRDAAVVFKRHDRHTGDTRYIYHGNDGTSMPWNDTAQLNFLRSDVREAVIQTILNVARRFPVIRLDAAMTLARKHYQRLWFPFPGAGGGIPSRAEHGMPREEFERVMPHEFWREVVDRITRELPDTLLLAEAFWLMEGYFVRTLGMHRVYNSAFMNMLKMEENAKYRDVVKNVLAFDPRILRRFVNFMNNPDEETAVAQFGTGDKYFGICLMMVTMPGLPMFGHGQIEGFREKYGMEYRRPYWNELPDWGLVRRHEAEIFPLMKKRHLFSGVEQFVLYDFYRSSGSVNENVFAYSNRCGGDRALIVYNNKYEGAEGWIRTSCAIAAGADKRGRTRIVRKTLGEGLGISEDPSRYYIFMDYRTRLEHLMPGRDLARQGLFVNLDAFGYHIFMEFREVVDHAPYHYRTLSRQLAGGGVPSVDEAIRALVLAPVHGPLRRAVNRAMAKKFLDDPAAGRRLFRQQADELCVAVAGRGTGRPRMLKELVAELTAVPIILEMRAGRTDSAKILREGMPDDKLFVGTILSWLITRAVATSTCAEDTPARSVGVMEELLFAPVIAEEFRGYGLDAWSSSRHAALIKALTAHHRWASGGSTESGIAALVRILNDNDARTVLGVNRYTGVLWLNCEALDQLLYWLLVVATVHLIAGGSGGRELGRAMDRCRAVLGRVRDAADRSGYELEKLLMLLAPPQGARDE
ncbi:MAG: alpha-amylase, partial [Candidatus Aureabacteria bacterium]|nr:alpha-amylase [Candidatus Auribacterota bacterium]